jgi:hypothetical protein
VTTASLISAIFNIIKELVPGKSRRKKKKRRERERQ